jgi:hypothetical protein
MKDCVDLVFVHKGYKWYLPFVLNQAKSVDPDSNIVLLGDCSKNNRINTASVKELRSSKYIERFTDKYIHMSTNSSGFELFCWLRWFYLLDYMHRSSIQSVMHLDSDVLLFSSLAEIKSYYADAIDDCGYIIPAQSFDSLKWSASAHISYWTYERLEEFCEFCIESFCNTKYLQLYEEKWNWHQQNNLTGGVCDMTTFYLFWLEKGSSIFNLGKQHHNHVFDGSMNSSANYNENEFETCRGIKKISFVDKKPMFTNSADGQKVRVHGCHFQGNTKQHIPAHYRGENFRGQKGTELSRNVINVLNKFR